MNSLLRLLLLPALLLASGSGFAQQVVHPLSADPGRALYAPAAQAQQRTTALPLPFFDDFTMPLEGPPSPVRWLPGGGTLVSNRLAVNPPTRGAVTFDGLRANGRNYSGQVSSGNTNIDTLTSQPINLAGLLPTDAVSLSFAWQTGSVIGGARASGSGGPVNLNLQFRNNLGRWATAPGWLVAPDFLGRSTGVPTTPFRQVIIPINQAQYLHGNFQFRFLATGSPDYARDTWSVDYVVLDRDRRPSPSGMPDTTFVDVATSTFSGNGPNARGLRRYTAMPVWQFNAASPPSSELNTQLRVNLTNLNAGALPLPVNVQGTVRELNSGTTLGNWFNRVINLTTMPRVTIVTGDASQVPIPATAQPKRLRYSLVLSSLETTPRTLPNDTIFRDVVLDTHYAYDDGSAEGTNNLTPQNTPSAIAYRFDLNQPDRVRGLRLYPIFAPGDILSRIVTVTIWADNNGRPGAILGSKTVTIPNPLPAGWAYYEATFDTPVAVTGLFYAGFSQPPTQRELTYGFDLNNTVPENYSWDNPTGTWTPTPANIRTRGVLMMRPVMNNNIATSTTTARDAAAFALFPNPTRGHVTITGPAFARAAVLDALGRTVWEQPAAEAGQRQLPLTGLAPGLYLVRLALPDGRAATRRLLVE